jgi:hypothetical protein
MNAFAKPHEIPDLGSEVYGRWRASTVGAIMEALQRRPILDLLGDVRGRTLLDGGAATAILRSSCTSVVRSSPASITRTR